MGEEKARVYQKRVRRECPAGAGEAVGAGAAVGAGEVVGAGMAVGAGDVVGVRAMCKTAERRRPPLFLSLSRGLIA